MKKEIIVYQTKSGALELKGDFKHETIWASLDQIANLFGRDKSVISRHIKNIFKDEELSRNSVVAFFATTASDGKKYQVEYFNLDVILSVGYRVNSKTATNFRQWATKTLREHITKGYTLNKKALAKNYDDFLQAVESVKKLLPSDSQFKSTDALELIKLFAGTWFSLDAYDKDELSTKGATKKTVKITGEALEKAIASLKASLIENGEATDMFASERDKGSLAGIVGNVMQSFDKKDLYPTVEEKAAHLFYFVVKNHPFLDGNKRSGAYAFIWFLRRAKILNPARLTPTALTALTLLIAESDPRQKEKMVRLVLTLIKP
jgi:prophage maintenance system killer protein